MRLTVVAIGRLKHGPERQLGERFRERAEKSGRALGFRAVEVVEVDESRSRDAGRRMIEESVAVAHLLPDRAALVILDERGDALASAAFAGRLGRWRDEGRSDAVFVIGGPDGLAESLRDRADLRLAFGAMTWPHQLVRIMLLEQIYRAMTILSGHPYHRA
ncbi:MAG TPA: 23S rRNA (pseudouridine(1915)-N(3))-methyltransferase RlmH [Xanthobacteraceae bacterium]|nr:23S rRNA (pseudouridine(1915)-N(3))-methyltransferase RlmH [Xanthobacteraceae bacterium]